MHDDGLRNIGLEYTKMFATRLAANYLYVYMNASTAELRFKLVRRRKYCALAYVCIDTVDLHKCPDTVCIFTPIVP